MNDATTQLLSLPALAKALRLSPAWIKAEADADRIPHFKAGARYRFNLQAVEATLSARAARQNPKAVRHAR